MSDIDHIALSKRYPTIASLQKAARWRIPKFAYDYLSGGIDNEVALDRNRQTLNELILKPHVIIDEVIPDLATSFLGQEFSAPFGIAPIGLSGLIWPNAARMMARGAVETNIPYCLSTVATTSLEKIAGDAGPNAWFQLYIVNDETINRDIIARAKQSNYKTIIVTVDVPYLARRPKDIANGLSVPPSIGVKSVLQTAMAPLWAFDTLRAGMPEFENLTPYVEPGQDLRSASHYISALARGHVTLDKLKLVRELWPGKMIVKGILDERDAKTAKDVGADAIIVSNHGGRQIDSAPSPLSVIDRVRKTVGKDMPIIMDSGVRSGLDVVRMLASGADFVMAGRAFGFGTAALGKIGVQHVHHILSEEMISAMSQLGFASPADCKIN